VPGIAFPPLGLLHGRRHHFLSAVYERLAHRPVTKE
jgi:hypothetical protein